MDRFFNNDIIVGTFSLLLLLGFLMVAVGGSVYLKHSMDMEKAQLELQKQNCR